MLEVRAEQGYNRGQAGSAGKPHGAVFANMNFLWAVLCPKPTSLDVKRGRLPFLLDVSSQPWEYTHTPPAPPASWNIAAHENIAQNCSLDDNAEIASNPDISFSEFYAPVWHLSQGSHSCLMLLCVPSTHPNLNFPHPQAVYTELIQCQERYGEAKAISFHPFSKTIIFLPLNCFAVK